MSYIKIFVGCFFSMAFLNSVYSQDTMFTLRKCVEIAIANNLDIKRNEYAARNNQAYLTEAKGSMLPYVQGNVTHGRNNGRNIDPFTNGYVNQSIDFANYSLDGSLSLWNGGSIRNGIKQNSLAYQASEKDLQQQKDNVTIQVILAYLQVLKSQEQLTQAQQQSEVTRRQAERLDVLNQSGATAPSTFYDMKGQLANDELNVVNVQNTLETSRLDLYQLMNIPYAPNMALEKVNNTDTIPVIYDGTADQIYQTALSQLAVIKAADLRSQSAASGVKAAKGQLLPTLSLNGGLGTNYSSAASLQNLINTQDVSTDNYVLIDNNKVPVFAPQPIYSSQKINYGSQWKNNFNSYVSIGLRIPLLNGLQARTRVKLAQVTQDQNAFIAQTTKIQLRQNVEQAYVNMNAAFQRYLTLTQQVKDFGESFRAAEVKFNAGASTSVEYQIAKNNVDQANLNLIAAKYDYILRTKILDYYQSKPLW